MTLLLVALVAAWAPASSVAGPLLAKRTFRMSVDTMGGDPNGYSYLPSITPDGRTVAYYSSASDLVVGDNNGWEDVYLYSVATRTTTRVSVDTGGGDPNGDSNSPSIDSTGQYVAFNSYASDIVPGDKNSLRDVFVRDVSAGTTVRASVSVDGGDALGGHSIFPSISADARHVAFHSGAYNLVGDDNNGIYDVFVRDLVAGTTERASVDMSGGDANGESFNPSISADGRYVAFESLASDLVPGDTNGLSDVFVRDLVAGTTVRVSVDQSGGDPDGGSFRASINANGRYVAFDSLASDLVSGDGNGFSDVFVRDVITGTTTRESPDMSGGDANADSTGPSINQTGRYLAFESLASDLVLGDMNHIKDIFVRDRLGAKTTRGSVDTSGGDPNGFSAGVSISSNGKLVGFYSDASDLIAGDGNDMNDVFLARVIYSLH
jgi:Tol biopolymer transport system component